MSQMRDYSKSDAEPGTLDYRVSRIGDCFFVIEEYANPQALIAHISTEFFKEMVVKVAELQAKLPEPLFFQEF